MTLLSFNPDSSATDVIGSRIRSAQLNAVMDTSIISRRDCAVDQFFQRLFGPIGMGSQDVEARRVGMAVIYIEEACTWVFQVDNRC
jgi:hypothetical protein